MAAQPEAEHLRQAIQALEAQRPLLGDAVVDAALAPLREKLASLATPHQAEQRKLVTVLFADLAGFTALAARLDAEDVREIINGYFRRWSACIERQKGVVEKFIGDAVLAVFGLPAAREDDPERAINAALEMQEELAHFNAQMQQQYGLQLAMRVGINTGEVVVSLLGERQGEGFVVVGDMVNLASRVQAAAPVDGILITYNTYRHVRGLFEAAPYGALQLKGIEQPVESYLIERAIPKAFHLGSRGVEGIATSMIGRQQEFALLERAFQQVVVERERRMLTLVAEAGVGKSRLLYEFENWLRLQPEPVEYLRGRGYPSTQHLPFSLLRDLFAFHWQIQDSDPPTAVRDKVERRVAALLGAGEVGQAKAHLIARLLGFEIGESEHLRSVSGDAKALHNRASVHLGDYLRALGAARPAVILLEDLHWADDSSLELIERLATVLAGRPILILCTARPALFEQQPTWGEPFAFHTRLDLAPLDRDASRLLVAQILARVKAIPPALLELVVNTAEGNPFFVEELIKMLIDDGVILASQEEWQVEEARLGRLRVPPTLTGVLQARLDSLELAPRAQLQRGAVVGRVFWEAAVNALAAPDSASPETLDDLSRRELIFKREESDFEGTTEYLFKHALLRDVTYASMLRRERRAYHGRAARWLEEVSERIQRSAKFAMLIAEHYDAAGENEPAAAWYLRAGRTAAAQFANSEALRALTRALELAAAPAPEWTFAALFEREQIYNLLGRREAQLADLEAMRASAARAGDPFLIAKAAMQRAQYDFQTGDYAGALEHGRRAEELAAQGHFPELAAQSLLLQSSTVARQGNPTLADALGERALAITGAHGLTRIEADVQRQLGLAAQNRGDHAQARDHATRALQLYAQLGDRTGEALTLLLLGSIVRDSGEIDEAGRLYSQALDFSRAIGDRTGEGRSLNGLGVVFLLQERYAQAEEAYLQALQLQREAGNRSAAISVLDNLGNLARARHDFDQAEAYYTQAIAESRAIGDQLNESYALHNYTQLFIAIGDYATARSMAARCMELSEQLDDMEGYCLGLLSLSNCLAVVREQPQAQESIHRLAELARENDFRSIEACAYHLEGSLLYELGDAAQAAARYRQAYDLRRELGEGPESMASLAGVAQSLAILGKLDEASAAAEELIPYTEGKMTGLDEPSELFLACYRVLRARGDARAAPLLQRGYELLQATAARIKSETARRSFLERVLVNRALVDAWQGEA